MALFGKAEEIVTYFKHFIGCPYDKCHVLSFKKSSYRAEVACLKSCAPCGLRMPALQGGPEHRAVQAGRERSGRKEQAGREAMRRQ